MPNGFLVIRKVGGEKTIFSYQIFRQPSIPVTRPAIYIQISNISSSYPTLKESLLPNLSQNFFGNPSHI
jgi:hypothetical protein